MVNAPPTTPPAVPHGGSSLDAGADAGPSTHVLVTAEMLNGHGILHGGHVFALARQLFVRCPTATGDTPRLSQANVTYIAPVDCGQVLTITTLVRARYGRHMICEMEFRDTHGRLTALVRCSGSAVRSMHENRK